MHGGYDGYIYKQETGSTFTNAGNSTITIKGRYKSAHWTMGDPGIRKRFHRAILNYRPEGSLSTNLGLEYDYGSDDVLNPNSIAIAGAQEGAAVYGSSVYGTAEYGGAEFVLVRQPIVGSGFAVALQFTDSAATQCSPYSLKGFSLEFAAAGRR